MTNKVEKEHLSQFVKDAVEFAREYSRYSYENKQIVTNESGIPENHSEKFVLVNKNDGLPSECILVQNFVLSMVRKTLVRYDYDEVLDCYMLAYFSFGDMEYFYSAYSGKMYSRCRSSEDSWVVFRSIYDMASIIYDTFGGNVKAKGSSNYRYMYLLSWGRNSFASDDGYVQTPSLYIPCHFLNYLLCHDDEVEEGKEGIRKLIAVDSDSFDILSKATGIVAHVCSFNLVREVGSDLLSVVRHINNGALLEKFPLSENAMLGTFYQRYSVGFAPLLLAEINDLPDNKKEVERYIKNSSFLDLSTLDYAIRNRDIWTRGIYVVSYLHLLSSKFGYRENEMTYYDKPVLCYNKFINDVLEGKLDKWTLDMRVIMLSRSEASNVGGIIPEELSSYPYYKEHEPIAPWK